MEKMMKFIFALLLSFTIASAAYAEDAKTPKPTIESLQKQVNFLNIALGIAIEQRDAAQRQLSNLELQDAANVKQDSESLQADHK